MTQIKDGGPAFPLQSIGPAFEPGYAGMTLRDYFAAKAMQAWFTDPTAPFDAPSLLDKAAKYSYEIADAMMREREKS